MTEPPAGIGQSSSSTFSRSGILEAAAGSGAPPELVRVEPVALVPFVVELGGSDLPRVDGVRLGVELRVVLVGRAEEVDGEQAATSADQTANPTTSLNLSNASVRQCRASGHHMTPSSGINASPTLNRQPSDR